MRKARRLCISGAAGLIIRRQGLCFMEKVFIYWDNSNIFHEAQRLAEEVENSPDARFRVRINFDNLLRLAHGDCPVEKALAVGSVPPEMQQLWNRMESKGVEGHLYDRGSRDCGEQGVPDKLLQLSMLEDALDYTGGHHEKQEKSKVI